MTNFFKKIISAGCPFIFLFYGILLKGADEDRRVLTAEEYQELIADLQKVKEIFTDQKKKMYEEAFDHLKVVVSLLKKVQWDVRVFEVCKCFIDALDKFHLDDIAELEKNLTIFHELEEAADMHSQETSSDLAQDIYKMINSAFTTLYYAIDKVADSLILINKYGEKYVPLSFRYHHFVSSCMAYGEYAEREKNSPKALLYYKAAYNCFYVVKYESKLHQDFFHVVFAKVVDIYRSEKNNEALIRFLEEALHDFGEEPFYQNSSGRSRRVNDTFFYAGIYGKEVAQERSIHHALAELYTGQKERTKGLLYAQKAFRKIDSEINEKWVALLGLLGFLYFEEKKYQEAIPFLEKYIGVLLAREVPLGVDVYHYLSRLGASYEQLGDTQEARAVWEQTLEVLIAQGKQDSEECSIVQQKLKDYTNNNLGSMDRYGLKRRAHSKIASFYFHSDAHQWAFIGKTLLTAVATLAYLCYLFEKGKNINFKKSSVFVPPIFLVPMIATIFLYKCPKTEIYADHILVTTPKFLTEIFIVDLLFVFFKMMIELPWKPLFFIKKKIPYSSIKKIVNFHVVIDCKQLLIYYELNGKEEEVLVRVKGRTYRTMTKAQTEQIAIKDILSLMGFAIQHKALQPTFDLSKIGLSSP